MLARLRHCLDLRAELPRLDIRRASRGLASIGAACAPPAALALFMLFWSGILPEGVPGRSTPAVALESHLLGGVAEEMIDAAADVLDHRWAQVYPRGEAEAEDGDFCTVSLADVPQALRFADYPARRTVARTAEPMIVDDRLLRHPLEAEDIRQSVREGPDFAGDYTIAQLGCGTACSNWMIVDGRSGRIFVPPAELQMIFGSAHFEDERLIYRRDSRLIVVAGTANVLEELLGPSLAASGEGFLFLLWTGRALQPLHFEPLSALCPDHRPLRERLVPSPYNDRIAAPPGGGRG